MCKKILPLVLISVLLGITACILGFQAYYQAPAPTPQPTWKQLPQPPARVSRFVGHAYIDFGTEGSYEDLPQVVASAADGTLYAVTYQEDESAWSRLDALPSPPESNAVSRPCEYSDELPGTIATPPVSGKVIDCYEMLYLKTTGPHYLYFLLAEDGSVWVLDKPGRGVGPFPLIEPGLAGLAWGLAGLLVGALLGLLLIKLGPVLSARGRKKPV